MIICKNCGQKLADYVRKCPICGSPVEPDDTLAEDSGGQEPIWKRPVEDPAWANPEWKKRTEDSNQENSGWNRQSETGAQGDFGWNRQSETGAPREDGWNFQTAQNAMNEHPMKWYKFVINVQLFITAMTCIYNAFGLLSGNSYGQGVSEQVYAYYGNGLRVFDTFLGIVYFLTGAYSIVTRQSLKNLKKSGPMMYLFCYVINAAINLFVIMGSYYFTGVFAVSALEVLMFLEAAVCIVLNYIYFKKRKDVFVN